MRVEIKLVYSVPQDGSVLRDIVVTASGRESLETLKRAAVERIRDVQNTPGTVREEVSYSMTEYVYGRRVEARLKFIERKVVEAVG